MTTAPLSPSPGALGSGGSDRVDPVLRPAGVALGAFGIALGSLVLVAPRLATRLFRFPADQVTPAAVVFGRLYAIREIARGAQLLHESSAPQGVRTTTLTTNLAIDGFDASMFAVLTLVRPDLRRAGGPLTAFAGGFTIVWCWLVRRGRRRDRARPGHRGA